MAFAWFLYNTHLSVTCPHLLYLATRLTIVCLDSSSSCTLVSCSLWKQHEATCIYAKSCIIVLPVNVLTGVMHQLLGQHDTLPCVLIYAGMEVFLHHAGYTLRIQTEYAYGIEQDH